MKCFYHRDVDAIGICKHCQKGLCSDCLVESPSGITCKGQCESELRDLMTMVQKGKSDIKATSQTYARNAIIMLLFGLLLLFTGMSFGGRVLIFSGSAGLMFLLGAVFSYWSSRQIGN